MNKSNSDRAKLLGMPFGTANSKLRKLLLFSLAQKLGSDYCFRCDARIETVDDFSIEHKVPWRASSDPVASFFDMENISFSHLFCNTQHGRSLNRKYDSEQDRIRAKWHREYADPERYRKHLDDKKRLYHKNKDRR